MVSKRFTPSLIVCVSVSLSFCLWFVVKDVFSVATTVNCSAMPR